jgi:hypothetical protein
MSHGGSSRVVAWDAPFGGEGPHRFLPYPYPYPYQFPGTVGSQRRAQEEARFLDVDVDVNVVVNVNVVRTGARYEPVEPHSLSAHLEPPRLTRGLSL